MKKLLFFVLMLAVVFSSRALVTKAADPVCTGGQVLQNGQCVTPSGSSLATILASYCKAGQVEYTEWSDCDHRFGAHGLQWRQIVYPTPNSCRPSVYDQLSGTRECLQ